MADGLSLAASVLAFATAALRSIQILSQTICDVKDAPEAIKSINADLQVIKPVLRRLASELQSKDQAMMLCDDIKPAVINCDRACKVFQEKMQRWTRHSTADKTFWVDRWRVALFGQDRIRTFRAQLSDCKMTLNVALSTSNVLAMIRHGVLLESMKDAILQQNEVVLQQEVVRAERNKVRIEKNIGRLSSRSNQIDVPSAETLKRSKDELLEEILHHQASNDALRRTCEECISRLTYERIGHTIKGTRANDDGTAIAGFINTSGESLNTRLDISDTTAHGHGFAVAGVMMNLNFRDLRQGRSSTVRHERPW